MGTDPVEGGTPPGASRWRRGTIVLLQLLLTGLVTWFILRTVGLNLSELKAFDLSTLRIRPWLLVLSLVLLALAYLYAASLWGLMVRDLGQAEVGIVPSWRVVFTANLGRYVPGKLWQIAGMAYLGRREGVPAVTASGAAVLGQAFSLAGATLVGAGVLLRGPEAGGWGPIGGVMILVVLLASVSVPAVLRLLLRAWSRLARESMPSGFHPDATFGVRWTGLYALGWLIQGGAFLALTYGLGMRLSLLDGLPAYPAAYVLGYVAVFAPAGLGVREGVLIAFLDPMLGAGAAVLAVFARLWATAVELVLALALASTYIRSHGTGGGGRV